MEPSCRPSAESQPPAQTSFAVLVDAEPSALARVLNVFALRALVPTRLRSTAEPRDGRPASVDRLRIDIQVAALDLGSAELIERKLGVMVGVRSVSVENQVCPPEF
jgi:acetolactate synthase small subunit